MMKLKSLLVTSIIVFSSINLNLATAADQPWAIPELVSFEFSPKEIELTQLNQTVSVIVKVSHPIGIKSEKINIYLRNAINPQSFVYQFAALRTQNITQNNLTTATFTSSFKLPTTIASGVWNLSSESIQGLASINAIGWPESASFTPANLRDMNGAENSLLVRLDGNLNYDLQTFVGPAYRSQAMASDDKPMTLNVEPPIWKVGEVIDTSKYFQLRVKAVPLEMISKTPQICQATGSFLKLLTTGECNYRVFTSKTKDYIYKELNLYSTVTQARIKPELSIPKIINQTSEGLPKTISRDTVHFYGSILSPKTLTPSVCIPTNTGITLYSGGICELQYSTEATLTYLASDIYLQRFEVIRNAQTISFTPPATANLSAKSLALTATASSGAAVTYSTTSTGICSVTGSTLNLLKSGNCSITATQAGTSTLAPISATSTVMITGSLAPVNKTITCVKGKSTKKVSGANPKCPKGYKLKK
jgi:hypothetical protein